MSRIVNDLYVDGTLTATRLITTAGTLTGISLFTGTNATITNIQGTNATYNNINTTTLVTSTITPLTNGIISVGNVRIESGSVSLYNNGFYTRLQTDTSKNVILAHVSDDQNFSQIATRQFTNTQHRDFTNTSQLAKITASDGSNDDNFGISVAISGNYILVGSYDDDIGTKSNQGSAYIYEKLADGSIVEVTKLTASDGTAGDQFGNSVAIGGNYVIVGANSKTVGVNTFQGSAYIFERNTFGTWLQVQKLTASDGTTGDQFGFSVAISGNYVIVGAYNDKVGANTDQGSAYIFERNNDGLWLQKTQLTASDGAIGDNFGRSVSISGNYAVIGANLDDAPNTNQGSAYIFSRSSAGMWSQTQKLTASDGAISDEFGISVSIGGNYILVGANGDNSSQGSAYLFSRTSPSVWSQSQKFTASDGITFSSFGYSVSISGDYAVIGAYLDNIGTNTDQGSVYIFGRTASTTWVQIKKLTTSDGAISDNFGNSVAIDGHTIVVGAYLDDIGSNANQGSAYVFEAPLMENAIVTGNIVAPDGIVDVGNVRIESGSVSLSNNGFYTKIQTDTSKNVILAHVSDDQNFSQIATRQFTNTQHRDFTNTSQLTSLVASDGTSSDNFGNSVAISGNYIVIGSYLDDGGTKTDQGSAYIYEKLSDGSIVEVTKLTASDGTSGDLFGTSVSISGNYVIVGAYFDDIGSILDQGSAYIFERNTFGAWPQVQKLTASDGTTGDQFGFSVAISGNYAIIGAYSDNIGSNTDQGSAYIFERNNGGVWLQKTQLTASDGATNDIFGSSVAIEGNYAVVGAIGKLTNRGAVYIFTRDTLGVWSETQKITASDGATSDQFGESVSISGNYILVGADGDNSSQGSAYLFSRTSTSVWSQLQKFTASDGIASSSFGFSVSICGNYAVIGAYLDNIGANTDQGSVYIFGKTASTTWSQIKKLTASDGVASDIFGNSVAIDGHTVAVGAPFDNIGANTDQGSAYIFEAPLMENAIVTSNIIAPDGIINVDTIRIESGSVSLYNNGFYTKLQTDTSKNVILAHVSDDQNFSQIATRQYVEIRNRDFTNTTQLTSIVASDAVANDLFGNSVSISGNYIVVGSAFSDPTGSASGSAYIFEKLNDGSVIQIQKITASDGSTNNSYGAGVAISGNYIIVGSPLRDVGGSNRGSAYIYERNHNRASSSQWSQTQILTAGTTGDEFGISVSVSGNYAIIGASFTDVGAISNQGCAYIFERNNNGSWFQKTQLTSSDGTTSDQFGYNVDIDGNYAVVGAPFSDNGTKVDQGSAYIFVRDVVANSWSQLQKLTSSDGTGNDKFGWSVHIDGNNVLVGAPFKTIGSNASQGAVYLFSTTATGGFTQQAILTSTDGSTNEHYGTSVSISGDALVIGAPFAKIDTSQGNVAGATNGTNAGYTYMYNRTGATVWSLSKKLLTTNTTNAFGWDVDIDGHTIVSGALRDTVTATGQGVVYIFEAPLMENAIVTNNLITSTITPLTGGIINVGNVRIESGSVSLSNNGFYTKLQTDTSKNVILAHVSDDQNFSQIATRQYVNTQHRDFNDVIQTDKLTFSGVANDSFGGVVDGAYTIQGNGPVSVSGNYIAVGAYRTNVTAGAVYMYEILSDRSTIQLQTLTASDTASNDRFGWSVSLSGNYLIVGAPNNTVTLSNQGSAYIFERSSQDGSTRWVENSRLVASNAVANDNFGANVAVSGNYAIVGAPSRAGGGAIYIFERNNGSSWLQVSNLTASDSASGDQFGRSVAIDGKYAVVGAPTNTVATSNQGSAYVFERTNSGTWVQTQRFVASSATINGNFGSATAISGNYIIIGAPQQSGSSHVGEAYIFGRSGVSLSGLSTWTQNDTLLPSTITSDDSFGGSVGISGNCAIVGAYYDNTLGATISARTDIGSVHVFTRYTPVLWAQNQLIQGSDSTSLDYFGSAVSIDGSTIVVGANGASSKKGATYLFEASPRNIIYGAEMSMTNATQNITNSTITKVNFNTIEIDLYNLIDLTSDKITIRRAGYYAIYTNIRWTASSAGYRELKIYVNDTFTRNSLIGVPTPTSAGPEHLENFVLFLTAGDAVDIRVFQSSGGSLPLLGGSSVETSIRAGLYYIGHT